MEQAQFDKIASEAFSNEIQKIAVSTELMSASKAMRWARQHGEYDVKKVFEISKNVQEDLNKRFGKLNLLGKSEIPVKHPSHGVALSHLSAENLPRRNMRAGGINPDTGESFQDNKLLNLIRKGIK